MDTKTEFARRRRLISIMLFVMACLMLSLFFIRITLWDVIVVIVSAVLVALSMRLNRCPACNAKIKNDEAKECENCGAELR